MMQMNSELSVLLGCNVQCSMCNTSVCRFNSESLKKKCSQIKLLFNRMLTNVFGNEVDETFATSDWVSVRIQGEPKSVDKIVFVRKMEIVDFKGI